MKEPFLITDDELLFVEATGCVQQIRQVLLSFISGHLRGTNSTSCGSALVDPAMVVGKAGTSRDQTTHDDVLFQTTQFITLATNGGFGQNASGFLEGSCRDEGLVLRDALVIPIST